MAAFYFKNPERCTRCALPFEPGEPLFMVRENVVWRTYLNAGQVMTQNETVPVCTACVTPEEDARDRYELRCPGCDRVLSVEAAGGPRCCSNRCVQRLRRRRRHAERQRRCDTCQEPFTPARADARYCSDSCRQRAYRGRRQAVAVEY